MVEAQKELETTKKLYFSWSLHDHDVRKHGREEGRNEKAVESARNMLKDNLPIEKISQYTGLSLEKIEDLEAELKAKLETELNKK